MSSTTSSTARLRPPPASSSLATLTVASSVRRPASTWQTIVREAW